MELTKENIIKIMRESLDVQAKQQGIFSFKFYFDKVAEAIVSQIDCRVSNDFCGNCTYLSVTEEEQNSNKKDEIHFCNLFKQRVLHFDKHPNLPRLDECKIIGKR